MIDSWAFGYLDCGSKTEELLLDAMGTSLVFDQYMLGEEWAVPVSILTPTVVRQAIQIVRIGSSEGPAGQARHRNEYRLLSAGLSALWNRQGML